MGEATAEWVEFVDSRYLVKLRFQAIDESEMYRGQEVVPGRLSWPGKLRYRAAQCQRDYNITIRKVNHTYS